MIALLNLLQRVLRPDLDSRSVAVRYLRMSDVVGVLYGFPLVFVGLYWLVTVTDIQTFTDNWVWMAIIFAAVVIFSRQRFYIMRELRDGLVLRSDGDFVGVVLWAAILIFGPTVIWLFILWTVIDSFFAFRKTINANMRWDAARSVVLNGASLVISTLASSTVYIRLGGVYPLKGLDGGSLFPAMTAVLVYAVIYFLIWLPFVGYIVWAQGRESSAHKTSQLFWFSVVTIELPFVSLPFGVLASGMYVEHNAGVLGLYFLGLFMIALLASQLSRSAARSQRQADQLMGLEQLGRDIMAAPVDARDLPALLRKHIPDMFPCHRVMVWLTPETYLLQYPDGKDSLAPGIWEWILAQTGPQSFIENSGFPWESEVRKHYSILASPIHDSTSGEIVGGLYIELSDLPQSWNKKTIREHYPALQNLAAQIATALKQAENFQANLQHQWVAQELRLAGDIQASFLPDRIPELPGWDLAASLVPARQTSGDFFDFFKLDDHRLGIIIADVADKGLGAALYMALGRTLLLTFSHAYPENPAAVLHATNQRMLSDARAQMFITAFYGVLDLETGRLIYSNAGHHPPMLVRKNTPSTVQRLNPNGMALGIDEEAAWVAVSLKIDQDDVLLMYTDGVVEANNPQGAFYGMSRLGEVVQRIANRPSQWIIRAIHEDVLSFQEDVAQSDDMTLVCIRHRGMKN
jgi:serine phosphatase RsbU (regulator of sigma subunit)